MKKRTVMHTERLNVVVKLLKSDFADQLITEGNKQFLPAGTLLKNKTAGDIREKGDYMLPIAVTDKADGILMHDVEFLNYQVEKVGTVSIEGVTYLDKLIEVGKEHKTPLTVTKDRLPAGITYIYKDRK
ncbi:MAG: hypothetical protein HXM47_02960 [Pseudoleptotrichia goodfellowii]|nr:hypothetical protein [Pseudoleptotrichia goodfellowii]